MSTPQPLAVICDTREPWPHPWRTHLPEHVNLVPATLETGDFALAGNESGAVVERKAVGDLLACIGQERERFERELARSRYVGRFVVVVEGTLEELIRAGHVQRSFNVNAIVGSLAAWQRRFCPIMFAGTPALAASFTLRFLMQPMAEAQELVRRVSYAAQNADREPVEAPVG